MQDQIEIASIDLRYEAYRMKNPGAERRLLASIAERGIEQPLEGVGAAPERILLNGFKRYRSARKLGIALVPYKAVGEDEAGGIVALLRISNDHALGILEQARFVGDLRLVHNLTLADIAGLLSRSKSWVSMRVGLCEEMGERVRERIFDGHFPVYSYMYTVRQFMRMNGERGKQDVEDFVELASGRNLSTREIELLAHAYFRGGESIRAELEAGKLSLILDQIKESSRNPEGASELERRLLKDLELAGKYMGRVVARRSDRRLGSRTFLAEANLLTAGALSRLPAFKTALGELYDRSGDAKSGLPPPPSGNGRARDCSESRDLS